MKNVKIKLKQDYKQFKEGFNIELKGNLIIISGVNGSGKSQLIDILKKEGTRSNTSIKLNIYADIKINDNDIDKILISRRSSKENFIINNIALPTPKNNLWHKEEAWKNFSDFAKWRNQTLEYSKSKTIVEEILNKSPINGFKSNTTFVPFGTDFKQISRSSNETFTVISEDLFKECLPENFIWEKDDIFSNKIDELFYEFAAKRHDLQAKMGRENRSFNNEEYIKDAPWTFLNQVFEKLNFNYRFKSDYEFETPNLKERPMIYPILNNGNIDLNSPRELSDLSDGEKTLISLTFALLNEKRRPMEKLLLLDEFDNTLNPSLIEKLFKVIEEYFINKDVVVIMTTHSPVTISLAPEYATYYELFKQDNNSPKIIEVDKYQYSELKIANKNFYNKIENQTDRIRELEESNKSKNTNKILFVEDKYTQIYKLAWLKLNNYNIDVNKLEEEFENNAPFAIFSKENKDSLKGYLANPFMDEWNEKKIVGLFDFDDAYNCFKELLSKKDTQQKWGSVQGTERTGLYIIREKYPNISALMLPIPEHRTEIAGQEYTSNRLEVELLFTDDVIEEIYGSNDYKKEKIIGSLEIPQISNKQHFWKKASYLPREKFNAFIPLFECINNLLDI